LYEIINKGGRTNLNELLKMESEFKCYIRPVIDDDYQGWGLVANNVSTSPEGSIYPWIYKLRQARALE
jgi:hypothetical protein